MPPLDARTVMMFGCLAVVLVAFATGKASAATGAGTSSPGVTSVTIAAP